MVIYIRSIDVGRYIYNYEGFYEKFAYQMSINREKSQLKVPMQALWEFSHFFGEVL